MTSVRDVSEMGKNPQGAPRDPQRYPIHCRGGETEAQGRGAWSRLRSEPRPVSSQGSFTA